MHISKMVLCGLLLITLFTVPAFATEEKLSEADTHKLCTSISGLATQVMEARQANVSMSTMMEKALEVENEAIRTIEVEMIKDAYKKSAYSSEKYRREAVRDFENTWYFVCLKMTDK